jgi:hypothetical protein
LVEAEVGLDRCAFSVHDAHRFVIFGHCGGIARLGRNIQKQDWQDIEKLLWRQVKFQWNLLLRK